MPRVPRARSMQPERIPNKVLHVKGTPAQGTPAQEVFEKLFKSQEGYVSTRTVCDVANQAPTL